MIKVTDVVKYKDQSWGDRKGVVTRISKDGRTAYIRWEGRKTDDVRLIDALEVVEEPAK